MRRLIRNGKPPLFIAMKRKAFMVFFIIWIAENLAIPFWVVGHVHLTMNVYKDIYEIIASCGMNIIVLIGMWLGWKKHLKENDKYFLDSCLLLKGQFEKMWRYVDWCNRKEYKRHIRWWKEKIGVCLWSMNKNIWWITCKI